MAELQHNLEGDDSFDNIPENTPEDASDDTVAFAQVEHSQVDNQAGSQAGDQANSQADNQSDTAETAQSEDSRDETLAEKLGEVADEDDLAEEDLAEDNHEDSASSTKVLFDVANSAKSADSVTSATSATSATPATPANSANTAFSADAGTAEADLAETESFEAVSSKEKKNFGNSALSLFYSLFIFVIVVAAAFFALHWYFHDRVAPGVNFGDSAISRNLTGAQEASVKQAVENAVNNTDFIIRDDRGNHFEADFNDLGVKVNQSATVHEIMSAKRNNLFTRIMPWVQKTVGLRAKVDDSVMDTYVLHKFVRERDRAVPYSAVFDKNSNSYTVEDGIPGRTVETMPVREAVKKLIAHPGKTVKVSVISRRTDAPIKRDAAQKLVDDLNKLLDKKITFNNGDGKDFTVPRDAIASWINVKADVTKRKLSYSIDPAKADDYLSQVLPKELNQQRVNQEDAINREGKFIFTTMKGANGVEISYSNSLANKAVEALRSGNNFATNVPSKITKFTVEQKLVEMRIVVDKSTQTASVYKNDELVKTFPVCTGRTGTDESTPGTFFIYLRYASQDMRGRNGDGSSYFSPGVRWVSYYHGGEGFHTASWNYNGIATGDAANHGSHGCINMYEQDARWIYENCPRGTIVEIVGNTPDGPVRQNE